MLPGEYSLTCFTWKPTCSATVAPWRTNGHARNPTIGQSDGHVYVPPLVVATTWLSTNPQWPMSPSFFVCVTVALSATQLRCAMNEKLELAVRFVPFLLTFRSWSA